MDARFHRTSRAMPRAPLISDQFTVAGPGPRLLAEGGQAAAKGAERLQLRVVPAASIQPLQGLPPAPRPASASSLGL